MTKLFEGPAVAERYSRSLLARTLRQALAGVAGLAVFAAMVAGAEFASARLFPFSPVEGLDDEVVLAAAIASAPPSRRDQASYGVSG